MPEIDDDIKTTANAIVQDTATLTSIEEEKLQLDAKDPRVTELSAQAVVVATRVLQEARIERALVAEANQPEAQMPQPDTQTPSR